jgi:flagellar hook-associated protein 3 FlgL
MRISTFWMQQQSVNAMLDQQAAVARTQLQLSSRKRILSPSDDPAGSAQAIGLGHADAALTQYQRNIDSVDASLGLEDQTLSSVSDLLGRVRTLALEGGNGSMDADARKNLATEVRQRLAQLVQLGNTRDPGGDYIFAGARTATQPFVQTPAGVSYAGDQQQRAVAIAPGQTIETGDPGSAVFQQIPSGNGYFELAAAPGNQGTLVSGATSVSDIAAWDRGSYQIAFTAPGSYEVRDASNNLVGSGSYSDPTTIEFRGVQVAFTGTPAAGDSYQVSPSGSKDMFSTLSEIASALEATDLTPHDAAAISDRLGRAVDNLDRASDRIVDIRARIGARMNTADDQQSLNGSVAIDVKAQLGKVRDVDYASAISTLSLQMTGLQAAQQTYAKLQGLSLFNYLK